MAARLSVYIERAGIFVVPEPSERVVAILIVIGNRSEIPNGIARVELEVRYAPGGTDEIPLRLNAEANPAPIFLNQGPELSVPIHLEPKQTCRGWCYFRLPPGLLSPTIPINDQELRIFDTSDNLSIVRPDLLNEIPAPL